MKRQLCGIDLNGWRDLALRNWSRTADGDVVSQEAQIDGGTLSSLVKVGDCDANHWVGGYQATMAPHGRSGGWGRVIGKPDRRLAVRDLLAKQTPPDHLLAAALLGLAKDATHAVLAVDDTPNEDEMRQDALLEAMRHAGLRRRLLVWRPVLTLLAVMRDQPFNTDTQVGIINHTRAGFGIQTLKIRHEAGRGRSLFAPERRSAGILEVSQAGYDGLAETAQMVVSAAGIDLSKCDFPKAIGSLTLGMPTISEILKTDLSAWIKFTPPDAIDVPILTLSPEACQKLDGCEHIIFESLTEGHIRQNIETSLSRLLSRPIISTPVTVVAKGAMIAARRMSADEPIYFDFLPQISTIVMAGDDHAPINFDLIEQNELLPAGQIYRSRSPAKLSLSVGQEHISVYLHKETVKWPRKAQVDLGAKVVRPEPVELLVEQAPLNGSARIILRSPALSKQHTVDWGRAEEIPQDWSDLIANLERPMPTIPNRLVLPCGIEPWEPRNGRPGMLALLAKNDGERAVDWTSLAQVMSSRPFGNYCISSDGDIPKGVPDNAIAQLDRMTARALEEELERLKQRSPQDNARLRFLLWQFRRCPKALLHALTPLVEDEAAGAQAFPYQASWKLLFQGLGRCANDADLERKIINSILRRPVNSWRWEKENACLSFLLSRSDTAPFALTRHDIETIAKAVLSDFAANHSSYTRFFYAPFLMVGLLRWRMVEPFALVVGKDGVADRFSAMVKKTLPDIRRQAVALSKLKKYPPLLEQTLEELRGEGSNPELLLDIYS